MLVSKSKKFVFIHVPKTGGTSMTGALAPYGERWRKGTKIKDVHGWQARHHANSKMHSGFDSDPEARKKYEGYYFFGFVRNPWDRIVSIYSKIGKGLPLDKFLEMINLNKVDPEFAKSRLVNFIAMPMHGWLDLDGKQGVDFVGRFESLQEDFLKAQWNIGFREPLKMPHYNPGNHKPYQEYYDDKTRGMVAKMYKGDIERYEYTF